MPIFSTRGGNKGAHGRYVRDYPILVDRLLSKYSREEAMLAAVGGDDALGRSLFSVLDRIGFRDGAYLIDVGCGSGRLTRHIAQFPRAKYLGTDVSGKLLAYAMETSQRPDFLFKLVDSTIIPEADNAADFVSFFSVGTHMLNEEFFLYLLEAGRVSKPGGKIVFSFLDLQTPHGRQVFADTFSTVHSGAELPHLNVCIGRCDIPVWADLLQMKLLAVVPGDAPIAALGPPSDVANQQEADDRCLGQSLAVLQKL
ncbi:MAG: class I SAM-dependent methyltransferase [Xanthobacteraceae bacterium]